MRRDKGAAVTIMMRVGIGLLPALLLAGCQTTPPTGGAPPTTMSAANTAFRSRLAIAAVPVARLPYGPVEGCIYRAVTTDPAGRHSDRTLELSIRPVRERLLVSLAAGPQTSTALIGSDGRMYDFNLSGLGAPANPETYPALASKRAAELRGAGARDAYVLNELGVYFPRYAAAVMNPGQSVATILDENGRTWGRYVYRGTASHKGRDALLLDVVRVLGAPSQPEQTAGFALIDARQMVPLLLVLDSGGKIHLEQQRCR
jgi:hypothetical protein